MKFGVLAFLFFIISLSVQAQTKKVRKLSPYQTAIDKCFEGQIPSGQLYDNKKLYFEITKVFTLQASETTFREVDFTQDGQKRKLRYEEGIVKIYSVDADENVNLIKTEDMNETGKNSGMRYKVNSVEAKLNQHLNRAVVKSDFFKTEEFRSKQLSLELVWDSTQIKKLSAKFGPEKKLILECQRPSTQDICECKP
jgi:hypothetical protein